MLHTLAMRFFPIDDDLIALYEVIVPCSCRLGGESAAPMTVIAAEPITGEQVLSELARD